MSKAQKSLGWLDHPTYSFSYIAYFTFAITGGRTGNGVCIPWDSAARLGKRGKEGFVSFSRHAQYQSACEKGRGTLFCSTVMVYTYYQSPSAPHQLVQGPFVVVGSNLFCARQVSGTNISSQNFISFTYFLHHTGGRYLRCRTPI